MSRSLFVCRERGYINIEQEFVCLFDCLLRGCYIEGEHEFSFFPPLFVRLWGSKTEEDAAEGLPEENPEGGFRLSLARECLSIEGPDFP